MKKSGSQSESIGYDAVTGVFFVPASERERLRRGFPHDDIEGAIDQAGRHARRYPESFQDRIKADPERFLELDLEWQFFRPKPEADPANLAEVAQQIRVCPTFIFEALTGTVDEALAVKDLFVFYRLFYELGGTGFEPTDDPAADLAHLLEACGGDKGLPSLQEMDVRILKHLYATAVPSLQSDLASAFDQSRRAIAERLRYLRRLGLTHQPSGRRRGDVLTAKGKELLHHAERKQK
jgi:hypothetical protein